MSWPGALGRRLIAPMLGCIGAVATAQPMLWIDAAGRPSDAAREALALLAAASEDGLDPADYHAAALEAAAARLDAAGDNRAALPAAFDAELDTSLRRFLRELHSGRIAPRSAGFALPPRGVDYDVDALLRAAVDQRRLRALRDGLRPTFVQYERLRDALARYRALAAKLDEPLPQLPAVVRSGDAAAGVGALRRRLVALGDLSPDAASVADPARYDEALVAAVQRFQRRHGLAVDGAIGPATRAALAVPLAQRVRQIEFALERLRWLPRLDGQRFVAIDIPMFRLWAVRPGSAPLAMKVIVGRAFGTRTPVFAAQLRQVVFRPYWNVPRSIVRKELLAPIVRDPSYLERHDMEIVRGDGDDARVVPPTPGNLALLRDGALRLRQRPGDGNALGLVKFVFPNAADVYLHGTPAPSLFAQARRDFSHGCVRVEDPAALADWLLSDEPVPWTRERILAAMHGQRTRVVTLSRPLPVLLYYVTALVQADGELHFADDLYGHDARLLRLLAERRPAGGLPGAHATGVDVHEVGRGVVAHAAAPERDRGVAQVGERHVGQADVDRPSQ